ncbi:MAG: acetylornithine/succinylornithine family transaminase [Oscillospiraceae bacterium]|nr:acetylornithine/succinylornithine family transaminase [Oscillospiraceae bacterium]
MNNIKQRYTNVADTYGRFDVAITSGTNAIAFGEDGRQYIDLTSGIGVNSLGFCNKDWVKAVSDQAKVLNHVSNLYYTSPCAELAEKLCRITDCEKVFFANSGAEANECAIKAARKYSFDKYGRIRNKIITLVNSFHGRTVTTLSATGQDSMHNYFFPFTEGFEYIPAGDIEALKKNIVGACAVMIELVQGEGGVLELDIKYVQKIIDLCRENDILIIADEVQTGVGRTGTFLCSEQYYLKPDIVTLAKGLGGGLPIGAALFGQKTAAVLGAGTHGSTYGGNPIACAGANCVVDKVSDPAFLKDVVLKSSAAVNAIKEIPQIKSVSGMGLMLGLELDGIDALTAAKKCAEAGLLILTAKNKLRILPPLTISQGELIKGLEILKEVLSCLSPSKE